MNEQTIWVPVGQDITINWRLKYGYIPASEQPDIKAKQEYYRERKWATQESQQTLEY
jgi:hypothetical protein